MAKFVFLYSGGTMAENPESQQQVMHDWTSWFGSLGEAITDGGNPFGAATTIASDGRVSADGSLRATGYTLIGATSLDEASTMAKGCPVLTTGGSVDIYEALEM